MTPRSRALRDYAAVALKTVLLSLMMLAVGAATVVLVVTVLGAGLGSLVLLFLVLIWIVVLCVRR